MKNTDRSPLNVRRSRLFDFRLGDCYVLNPESKTDRRPCFGRGERRVFGTEPDLKVNNNKI